MAKTTEKAPPKAEKTDKHPIPDGRYYAVIKFPEGYKQVAISVQAGLVVSSEIPEDANAKEIVLEQTFDSMTLEVMK